MKLNHVVTIPSSADEVFAFMTNLQQVAACLPGAQLTDHDGDAYRGTVKIKVGPMTLNYDGAASIIERNDDERRVAIRASGRESGGRGGVEATFRALIGPTEDGSSLVEVETDLRLRGLAAQIGSGAIAGVADQLIAQFVANIAAVGMAAGSEPDAASPTVTVGPRATRSVTTTSAGSMAGAAGPVDAIDPARLIGAHLVTWLRQQRPALVIGVVVGVLLGRWSARRTRVEAGGLSGWPIDSRSPH